MSWGRRPNAIQIVKHFPLQALIWGHLNLTTNSLLVEIFHLQFLPKGDFSVCLGKLAGVHLSNGPDMKTSSPSKHLVFLTGTQMLLMDTGPRGPDVGRDGGDPVRACGEQDDP